MLSCIWNVTMYAESAEIRFFRLAYTLVDQNVWQFKPLSKTYDVFHIMDYNVFE